MDAPLEASGIPWNDMKPDLVVGFGAPLLSKSLRHTLRTADVDHLHIDPGHRFPQAFGSAPVGLGLPVSDALGALADLMIMPRFQRGALDVAMAVVGTSNPRPGPPMALAVAGRPLVRPHRPCPPPRRAADGVGPPPRQFHSGPLRPALPSPQPADTLVQPRSGGH